MLEMVQLLAAADPFVLVFSVLVFDIPRYTLWLLSLALFGALADEATECPRAKPRSSAIIPTFNGGSGLAR